MSSLSLNHRERFVPGKRPLDANPIVLSKGAIKQIHATGNPGLDKIVIDSVNQFCNLDYQDATRTLMQMSYGSPSTNRISYENALNKVGLTSDPEKTKTRVPKVYYVGVDIVRLVAKESLTHYKKINPTFVSVSCPDGCNKTFEALTSVLRSEPVLMYCIIIKLKSSAKDASAEKWAKELRSASEEEQRNALRTMGETGLYLNAMLPHAVHMGNLLAEILEQNKLRNKFVTPEPIALHLLESGATATAHHGQTVHENIQIDAVATAEHANVQPVIPIPKEVPLGLLKAVPEIAGMAPYIPYQVEILSFIGDYTNLLRSLHKWAEYGLNISAILDDPKAPTHFDGSEISDDFRQNLYTLVGNVKGTDVNSFVSAVNHLPVLFPAANALINAFSSADTLQEKHEAVCNLKPDPNNQEYLVAVEALNTAIKAAAGATQNYAKALPDFKNALSEHPLQPLQATK